MTRNERLVLESDSQHLLSAVSRMMTQVGLLKPDDTFYESCWKLVLLMEVNARLLIVKFTAVTRTTSLLTVTLFNNPDTYNLGKTPNANLLNQARHRTSPRTKTINSLQSTSPEAVNSESGR